MYSFRFNEVFPLAENDVIVLYPRGGAAAELYVRILKGWPQLQIVFNSNHTSIMHHFRYNPVLPLAGNDVIVLSPFGGAVSDFPPRILKGRPWLYIHVALTFCFYLEPFRSYSTLFIWLGFQHLRLFRVVFRGYHPQNWSDIVQTYKRHFLAPIHAFWAINHENRFRRLGCRRWQE